MLHEQRTGSIEYLGCKYLTHIKSRLTRKETNMKGMSSTARHFSNHRREYSGLSFSEAEREYLLRSMGRCYPCGPTRGSTTFLSHWQTKPFTAAVAWNAMKSKRNRRRLKRFFRYCRRSRTTIQSTIPIQCIFKGVRPLETIMNTQIFRTLLQTIDSHRCM